MSLLSDPRDAAKPRPLIGRSALVAEIRRLPPAKRKTLGLPEGALVFVDLFVSMFWTLTDDSDPRPLGERLTEDPGLSDSDWPEAVAAIEELSAYAENLPRSIRRLRPATA